MTKRKHIAFLHKVFPRGGAEKVTLDVANWLVGKGYEVSVLCYNFIEENYPVNSPRLFNIDIIPQGNIKKDRHIARFLQDYLISHAIDVLITYQKLQYATWLKEHTGVSYVYALQSVPYYEFIDQQQKFSGHKLIGKIYNATIVRILHFIFRNVYRRVYAETDAYGVLCEQYKQFLVDELRLSADTNKLYVLPNATDLPADVVLEKQKEIVFVGRLTHRDKRVDRLLRIWSIAQPLLPEWTLRIVGSGGDENNLKQLCKKLSLQKVTFEGHSDNVKKYLDRAAILCLTSSFEGWGLCIAEAQANAVVPILFNSYAAASALVSTPLQGVLIKPFDEKSYATALVNLATDTERRRKMQQEVLAKSKEYSVDHCGRHWLQMLDALTANS